MLSNQSCAAAKDTVPDFEIHYTTGDCFIKIWRINIVNDNGELKAYRTEPNRLYDYSVDTLAETTLSEVQANMLVDFITKARALSQATCPTDYNSSGTYLIRLGLYNLVVRGDCDWDGLSFWDIDSTLFNSDSNEKLEDALRKESGQIRNSK